ncbi:MAG TPA: uroporphyrinogen decarboxylase family protein [Phycisphaerae bacterium]|nr:uroporphyrinogen decarboxylase family protein [Phycisphaerae bacterium]
MKGVDVTRRERLMATLRGEPVDRPAVSFYEVGGSPVNPNDPDEFNIYNSPDWASLLRLAAEQTDLIHMRGPKQTPLPDNPSAEFFQTESFVRDGSRYTRTTLTVAGRTMASLRRQDPGVATSWQLEHLLRRVEDIKAYLQLPDEVFACEYDVSDLAAADQRVGDAGIIMVETADPLCIAADLFSMEDYLVVAMTEPKLFHQLLEKHSRHLYPKMERVAREFPGHLWRICGSEYASEPYLPPSLYEEYVVRYTRPMVETIHKYGGFARIHSHGRLKNILPHIRAMGPAGLDPIEPPPQGDVQLITVRRQYGKDMVLFGNLEASDLETLAPTKFEKKVIRALREGTAGEGRGFVLMPSSCPCGRKISDSTLKNYETMVRLAASWGG